MTEVIGREKSFLSTLREDKWWISPMLVLFGLLSFIIYSTWAAWQGEHFWVGSGGFGGYLSPFYSPTFFYWYCKRRNPTNLSYIIWRMASLVKLVAGAFSSLANLNIPSFFSLYLLLLSKSILQSIYVYATSLFSGRYSTKKL